ncbi:MAG TPA: hypothetical protein VMV48_02610, partial [Gallionellaceae bacterium]|nr:hypothetical protein [Gallionellaceae bacterium]
SGIGVSTKTDTTGAIAKIFDANKVTEEVNAQVQITQTFSQLAPKAVADFSGSRATNLRDEAKKENDLQKKQALLEDAAKWDEGGIYRVALHTVSGALSGGVNGAAGAVTTASAAPLLDDLQTKVQGTLVEQGMSPENAKLVAQGVAEATSAGLGAAVGGTQGAATGLAVDTNNRQLHPNETKRIAELAKGDPKMEERLTEAACSLVHCSAEYPEDSQERRYYEGVELRGQSDSYALRQLADAQKSDSALFSYSAVHLGLDKSKYVGNTFIRAGDKIVDFSTGVAKGSGNLVVQTGALALDAVQLAGAGVAGDGGENIDPYSDLGKAINKDGVVETISNIPGNTLRGIAGAVHSAGQGDVEPLGEIVGGVVVPIVAGKVVGRVGVVNTTDTLNLGRVPESVNTSSGISIQATPGKTTTILGSYSSDMNNIINEQLIYPKTTDFGPKPDGFNVLNVPNEMYKTKTPEQFWVEVNKPFLDTAIVRDDVFPLATKPTADVLYRDDGSLAGFGREVNHLISNGYHYDAAVGKMVKN